jgi:hypothetical protein
MIPATILLIFKLANKLNLKSIAKYEDKVIKWYGGKDEIATDE